MSGISTLWKDTYGCAKQYIFALDIYIINVVSSLYGTIMDRAVNAPGHGKNIFLGSMILTNVI